MGISFPATGRFRLHRSWLSVVPHLLFAFLATAAVYFASAGTKFYAVTLKIPFIYSGSPFQLPFFLLVFGFLLARPIFLMKDCHHTLGDHHLYSITGRLSLRKDNVEVPFEDILGVRSRQSIIERILNVGTVIAWTASAERAEVVMHGLRYPDDVVHAIRVRIDTALQQRPRARKGVNEAE